MAKERIRKIVGRISREVAVRYNLYELEGQEIVQSLDLYAHTVKHIKEFKSIDSYNNSLLNLEEILKNPYFVYYDKLKKSLQYFCEIDEDVCVVVKLKIKSKDDNYVSTIYPISKSKINRIKERSYIIQDEELVTN